MNSSDHDFRDWQHGFESLENQPAPRHVVHILPEVESIFVMRGSQVVARFYRVANGDPVFQGDADDAGDLTVITYKDGRKEVVTR